jgi:amidase
LPITIKDTIDTEGICTTYGSRLFAAHVPRSDAAVVAKLKAAGAIVLGKTNVPEMAIPYDAVNPVFGRTNNPHNLQRTSGGSSGGEASAIAAKLSPVGIGSDLSGSIRVPAHFCGIAGLKPTTGAVLMEGHLPRASGVLALGASIGPMARRVEDLDLIFRAIARGGQGNSVEDAAKRVAWFVNDGVAPVAKEIAAAVERAADGFTAAGWDVRCEEPPSFGFGQRLWVELFSRAANAEIQQLYRGREDQAGPLIAPFLKTTGQKTFAEKIQTAEELAKAVVEREQRREELLRWMRTTPLILAPVSATSAFAHETRRVEVDGQSISVFRSCSYSQTVNVFGLPAAVVPVARTAEGLPIGVQVIGRPFEEDRVLAAAAAIELAVGFS